MRSGLLLLVLLLTFTACHAWDRSSPEATLKGALAAAAAQDREALLGFYRPADRQALALGLAASRGAGVTSDATLTSFASASPLLLLQEESRAIFDLAPPTQALLTLEKLEGRWYICLPEADPSREDPGVDAALEGERQ